MKRLPLIEGPVGSRAVISISRFSLILHRFSGHPVGSVQTGQTDTHADTRYSPCGFPEFPRRRDQLPLVQRSHSERSLHDGDELLVLHVSAHWWRRRASAEFVAMTLPLPPAWVRSVGGSAPATSTSPLAQGSCRCRERRLSRGDSAAAVMKTTTTTTTKKKKPCSDLC